MRVVRVVYICAAVRYLIRFARGAALRCGTCPFTAHASSTSGSLFKCETKSQHDNKRHRGHRNDAFLPFRSHTRHDAEHAAISHVILFARRPRAVFAIDARSQTNERRNQAHASVPVNVDAADNTHSLSAHYATHTTHTQDRRHTHTHKRTRPTDTNSVLLSLYCTPMPRSAIPC